MDDYISRQAAIDAVRKNTFRLTFAEEQTCKGHVAWSAEAVYSDVMEGALLEIPSAQPEQKAGKTMRLIDANKLAEFANNTKDKTIDANDIMRFPTIDPVKHGHWEKMSDADGIYYACSECGEELTRIEKFDPQFDLFPRLKSIDKTHFCPNCGAKND